VGGWLRLIDDDGGDAVAWIRLHESARDGALRLAVRRRIRWDDRDDLVGVALVAAFRDDRAAPKRADPETPLAAWVAGVMTIEAAAQRRMAARALGVPLDGTEPTARPTEDDAPPQRHVESVIAAALARMTLLQRQAVRTVYIERQSQRRAARLLGITRDALRDRIERGLRSAGTGSPRDRSWALVAAERAASVGDPSAAALLRAYAAGARHGALAEEQRRGANAIRRKIHWLRLRYGPNV
jgi:DNA-directed RNA polymerase specialized sigma24 family protein